MSLALLHTSPPVTATLPFPHRKVLSRETCRSQHIQLTQYLLIPCRGDVAEDVHRAYERKLLLEADGVEQRP